MPQRINNPEIIRRVNNPEHSRRVKYIFVSGGLISGIGKGTTAASIALLLKSAGYKIAPIKFENYLNVDAGTINPIEHGDPFLCEDGTEADMDIGSYEKYLHQDMGKDNFVTMGKIYQTVIEKERRFEYNGEDVEAIPHITDEIQRRIKHLAKVSGADIVIIELGGTAGEYQNIFYYEASRIMAWKNPGDVIHVHVSYVPTPAHLGEPKTKPTQLSVRTLNSMGIQPDFIVARSEKFLDQRRRDRFALFCNMNEDDIISNPDMKSSYEIPMTLNKQGMDEKILKKLGLPARNATPDSKDSVSGGYSVAGGPVGANLFEWKKLVERIESPKSKKIEIAIVGKYFGTGEYQLRDAYAALFDALDHASWAENVELKTRWVSAEKVDPSTCSGQGQHKHSTNEHIQMEIGNPDGIIVPIGWGERGAEGMITAANYARNKKIPYLGLCYGMQLAVVGFAREIMGWKDANTSENNQKTSHDVIHLIPSQKEFMERRSYGGTMRLGSWDAIVKRGTIAHKAYQKFDHIDLKTGLTSERHRHRWEFNNKFVKDFENAGLVISARSKVENLVEIIELPKSVHPFFLGTQGHPEYKSRPLTPHPLFREFIRVCKMQN